MVSHEVSVQTYIQAIPVERREVFIKLLSVIRENIPEGFSEGFAYGGPAFFVPHTLYPPGYHVDPNKPLPFISVLNQKHYIGLYHMGIYAREDLLTWFREQWSRLSIGRLDMGKSCIRLKRLDAVPYELLGELCRAITVSEWIVLYEKQRRTAGQGR